MKLISKIILLALFAGFIPASAQNPQIDDDTFLGQWGEGEFTLKGNMTGRPEGQYTIEFAVTDYLENHAYKIEVDENGGFEGTFPVIDIQEVYLYLGDAVTVFAYPGAELFVEFDHNDLPGSVSASSPDPVYDKDLRLAVEVYRQTRRDLIDLNMITYDRSKTIADRIESSNSYINKVNTVVQDFVARDGETRYTGNSLMNAYFNAAMFANGSIQILEALDDSSLVVKGQVKPYRQLNYYRFRSVPEYRSFLNGFAFYQSQPFISVTAPLDQVDRNINELLSKILAFDAMCGEIPFIRDCLVSSRMFYTMEDYNIKDITEAYEWYLQECLTQRFRDEVEQVYNNVLLIVEGSEAPDFTLPDFEGNMVSLSQLRGKPVYIDFWGMNCGPCMYEFRTSARELHEKYGEDVTFVYIAVTGKKDQLEQVISTYDLQGIHLIADGWSDNQACKAYNVKGIPHYVLIDAEGRIISPAAKRPSQMLSSGSSSQIGQLLVK